MLPSWELTQRLPEVGPTIPLTSRLIEISLDVLRFIIEVPKN